MLDTVPDLIMAVNEGGEVNFCNQTFLETTHLTSKDLLGRSYLSFFKEDPVGALNAMVEDLSSDCILPGSCKSYQKIQLLNKKRKKINVDVMVTPFNLDDEQLFVLIIRPISKKSSERLGGNIPMDSLDVIKELNQNRDRIQKLEASLSRITPNTLQEQPELIKDLHAVDTALKKKVFPLRTVTINFPFRNVL